MLDLRQRWVQYQEIYVTSSPQHAPDIPLIDILEKMRTRVKAGNCVKIIERDQGAIRVKQLVINKSKTIAVLLLQYANKNVTDPQFMHLKRGKLRKEPKLAGEGVAVSAHLAISLVPNDSVGSRYPILLEEVPGLSRSKISPFFKTEFKLVCSTDYEFNDNLDNDKVKNYHPNVQLLAEPIQELAEDFEKGVILNGAEVIELKPQNLILDEPGYYTTEKRTLKISIDHKHKPSDVISLLRKNAKKSGFDNIRLKYTTSEGNQKTAGFGTSKQDLVDALVAKKEKITATSDLDQCLEEINLSIRKQLVELIKAI